MARLRTDSSGLEVDARTSQHKFDQLSPGTRPAPCRCGHLGFGARRRQQKVQAARTEQSRANNEAQAAQAALQETTQKFRDAQRRLQEIDRNLAQKDRPPEAAPAIAREVGGVGEGAKAPLLQGRFSGIFGEQKFVPVTQGLEVRAEYAKAP